MGQTALCEACHRSADICDVAYTGDRGHWHLCEPCLSRYDTRDALIRAAGGEPSTVRCGSCGNYVINGRCRSRGFSCEGPENGSTFSHEDGSYLGTYRYREAR